MAADSSKPSWQTNPYQRPPTEPRAEVYFLGTAGYVLSREDAVQTREQLIQGVGRHGENVAVLVLDGAVFTPGALQELLLPLAQRVRAGEFGEVTLVLIAEDPGVADFVRMLATTHGLAMYVSDRPLSVGHAAPAGTLTTTEKQTIDALYEMGGRVTVASFAQQLHIQVNAAGNRLTNLSHRGYVHRTQRSRREGDAFVDPRRIAHEAIIRVNPQWARDDDLPHSQANDTRI